ncbi:uncharacterized protein [Procambarus clarkii]|uniref:uncharacterized protein isoform X7 n=1 Tax=Procambarus clarkii TaxID=6728 RepID=UPI003742923B
MKPTLKCCGRSWQQNCRKILADLHFAECGLESPEVPLSVAETESGESDYDAWTGAPLLCKRKSTKNIDGKVELQP